MRITFRASAALLAAALLPGCIVIPYPTVPEEDEFADDSVAWIVRGETTRDEVVARIGQPPVSRGAGSLAVYGQARTVGGMFFGSLWGSGGTMPFEKKSTLLIEYTDTGVVSRASVIRGEDGCNDAGLCVDAEFGMEYTGDLMERESSMDDAVVFLADHSARPEVQFRPVADSCGIYIYVGGVQRPVLVIGPTAEQTPLPADGYLFWAGEPGEREIRASLGYGWSANSIHCPANELRFVSLYVGSGTTGNPPAISLDDREAGESRVLARKLVFY